jgi:hypothetical protein
MTMALKEHTAARPAQATTASGSVRCQDCGHTVTVIHSLPECEFCSGRDWAPAPWSPFSKTR